MEKLTLLIVTVLVLGQTATATSAASDQAAAYTPEQIKEMPRFSSIEQQRCPKARYPSVKKRLECKHEVRIELYEKRQTREAAEQTSG